VNDGDTEEATKVALEKASIDVLNGSRAGERVAVLFNPFEYTIERANTYKASSIPGLSGPLISFVNGEADILTMELFLDDYTDGPPRDTQRRLDQIKSLLEIDGTLHAPPIVRFVWGTLSFKAIIEKLSRKITMFQPDGTPARASLTVTFKEYKTLPELVNEPRLQSSDRTKRRVMVGADSLWALAAREYGDAAQWRHIAFYNDVDDPRDVVAGDWVTVPPLENDDGPSELL
jgi:nucleoid-associated protein YgaU